MNNDLIKDVLIDHRPNLPYTGGYVVYEPPSN
nr:MAG TPA_asm: hypothetical protein [Caudoviricetes sp.]